MATDSLAEHEDNGEFGLDCDDGNADINPDAEELWYDGVDQNCDEQSDFDQDGDGFDSETYGGDDCDVLETTRFLARKTSTMMV